MQMGFYFDQTRCTGCYTCTVACKDWHDIPAGPASWMRVVTIEKGEFPNLFVAFLSTACYHCAQPACVSACPYEAPQFGAEENARMQMCNFCLDRLAQNKKPICVDCCPMRALDAGPMDKLRARYGEAKEATGFVFSTKTQPSIILKPKISD